MRFKIRAELGKAVDHFFEKQPNRYVRKIPALSMGVPFEKDEPSFTYWCDRCRTFTDNPERHDHDKRPLD